MIDISVIIPMYNAEEYVQECLDSVLLAIEKINAEVLIIDDGSTDRCSEIAQQISQHCDDVFYYRKNNEGPGSARNYGIKLARGKYLSFIDSDDLIDDSFLANMLVVAEQYCCDMVVCDTARVKERIITQSNLHHKAFYNLDNLNLNIKQNPTLVFDSTTCNKLILKSLFIENNIEYPVGYRYEDYPISMKLYCMAKRIRFIRLWQYYWRVRTGKTLSITQRHTEYRNVIDKIDMLEMTRRFMTGNSVGTRIIEALDYRIMILEFNATLKAVLKIDRASAIKYLDTVAQYLGKSVDLSLLYKLPLYDIQKNEYILKRDIDGLRRLLVYGTVNYKNAPIKKDNNHYTMKLHEGVFSINERNANNEYTCMPYAQCTDYIDYYEETIAVHAHIYARRINIPDINSQRNIVYLVNSRNNEMIELDVINEHRPELTKARGTVINYDDYKEYYYNYDGTGFVFYLNYETLCESEYFKGKNYILIKVTNDYGTSTQLLRHGTRRIKQSLQKGYSFFRGDYLITVRLNKVEYLEIEVEHYVLENADVEEDRIIFAFKDPLFIKDPVFKNMDKAVFCRYRRNDRMYFLPFSDINDIAGEMRLECRSNAQINIPVKCNKGFNESQFKYGGKLYKVKSDENNNVILHII